MNKLGKFLALAGLTGVATYLFLGLRNKSSFASSKTSTTSKQNSTKSANSIQRSENYKMALNHRTEYSNARTQKMYKDLGMTDEQRRHYERDYKTVMGIWEKNNSNYDIDEQDKIDEHNNLLNAVLNEDQFSMYREWFKNNRT